MSLCHVKAVAGVRQAEVLPTLPEEIDPPRTTEHPHVQEDPEWAILDSNQGPLPYQRSALTD